MRIYLIIKIIHLRNIFYNKYFKITFYIYNNLNMNV